MSDWYMNNHAIYVWNGNGGYTEIAQVKNVRACKALVNYARAMEDVELAMDVLLANEYTMPTRESTNDDNPE